MTAIAINLIIYIPYLNSLQTFGKRPSELILENLPKPASWIFSRDQWLIPPLSHGHSPEGWIFGAEQELFRDGFLSFCLFQQLLQLLPNSK